MRDDPPGLVAHSRISSFLKVVGLSTTRTPLDSVQVVVPRTASSLRATIARRRGRRRHQRGVDRRVDVGRDVAAGDAARIAASSASPGTARPSRCGASTVTTRLPVVTSSRSRASTSASVIVGSSSRASASRCSGPV